MDKLNLQEIYDEIYKKPMSELRLMGYIASNLKVTKNKFAYIILENDITPRINANTWPIFKKTAIAMEDISAGGSGQVYVIK